MTDVFGQISIVMSKSDSFSVGISILFIYLSHSFISGRRRIELGTLRLPVLRKPLLNPLQHGDCFHQRSTIILQSYMHITLTPLFHPGTGLNFKPYTSHTLETTAQPSTPLRLGQRSTIILQSYMHHCPRSRKLSNTLLTRKPRSIFTQSSKTSNPYIAYAFPLHRCIK